MILSPISKIVNGPRLPALKSSVKLEMPDRFHHRVITTKIKFCLFFKSSDQ